MREGNVGAVRLNTGKIYCIIVAVANLDSVRDLFTFEERVFFRPLELLRL